MRNQNFYRFILLITLLIAISLSCKTITKPIEKVSGIATDIEDMVGIATDINIEGLATDIDIGGMETDLAPVITEVQQLITEIPDLSGDKPADIPIIEGGEEIMASKGLITFTSEKSLREIVDFYESQMPLNGWVKVNAKIEEDAADLFFQKEARKATISIVEFPFIGSTVNITIEGG